LEARERDTGAVVNGLVDDVREQRDVLGGVVVDRHGIVRVAAHRHGARCSRH